MLPAKKDFDPKKDKPLSEGNLGSPVYSTPVIANGVHTGAKPGQVVRGPGWTGGSK